MLLGHPAVRIVLGILLLLSGVVWALQGLGVFPGNSPMNDQLIWTLIGIPVAILGGWMVATARRGPA